MTDDVLSKQTRIDELEREVGELKFKLIPAKQNAESLRNKEIMFNEKLEERDRTIAELQKEIGGLKHLNENLLFLTQSYTEDNDEIEHWLINAERLLIRTKTNLDDLLYRAINALNCETHRTKDEAIHKMMNELVSAIKQTGKKTRVKDLDISEF